MNMNRTGSSTQSLYIVDMTVYAECAQWSRISIRFLSEHFTTVHLRKIIQFDFFFSIKIEASNHMRNTNLI